MRIDLPHCNLKECRYCADGNCKDKNRYDQCHYAKLKDKEEELLDIKNKIQDISNEDIITNYDYIRSFSLPQLSAWVSLNISKFLNTCGIDTSKDFTMDLAETYIDFFLKEYDSEEIPKNIIELDLKKIRNKNQ